MRFPHIGETSVNCQKPVQCEWMPASGLLASRSKLDGMAGFELTSSRFDIQIPAVFMQNRLEWFAERLLLLRERVQKPNKITPPLDAAV
jgi:hypothetical protein